MWLLELVRNDGTVLTRPMNFVSNISTARETMFFAFKLATGCKFARIQSPRGVIVSSLYRDFNNMPVWR